MFDLILRLRFHVFTILVGVAAGIAIQDKWHQPLWEREGRWIASLPALIACVTWFRYVVANSAGGLPAFLFLGERLLVAYVAFAAAAALSFIYLAP